MTQQQDTIFLLEALALAKLRLGFCAPNPSVGALVVKANQVIASGYHQQAGCPHAEAVALNQLTKQQASGATLYVTLEPCNHQGRTPPCTELIIAKKIKRVVFGFKDPNSTVLGNGQQRLIKAGIACDYQPLDEIKLFYQSYAWFCLQQRPFVTAKIALSLNGKIATAHNEPIAITGATFQQWTHKQRLHSDALLTTAKTIIQDDPYLNVRLPEQTIVKPVYILDRNLQTPINAKIFSTDAPICLFYHAAKQEKIDALHALGACCIEVPLGLGGLNLEIILQYIAKQGYYALWLEAGGICFEQFVLQKLTNKAYVAIGLTWLAADAKNAFHQNIFSSAQSIHWFHVGDDAVCEIHWPLTGKK